MTDLRTAAQQALEFLDAEFGWSPGEAPRIDALRTALAQQDEPVEPVAWMCSNPELMAKGYERFASRCEGDWNIPVYTAPPQRKQAEQAEPVSADPHTTTLRNLLECCLSWEPDACVLGNVTARQAVATLRTALAQQAEPVEPVAWMVYTEGGASAYVTDNPRDLIGAYRALPLYTAPPQRLPLTEEEILAAVGWERAEMYMKLATNFPVDEAKQETLKNARAIERAVWEKNHG